MRRRLIIAAAFLLFPGMAQTAEIKLLASGALKQAYLEPLPNVRSGGERPQGHAGMVRCSPITSDRPDGDCAPSPPRVTAGTQALIKDGKLTASTRAVFCEIRDLHCGALRRPQAGYQFGRWVETVAPCCEVGRLL